MEVRQLSGFRQREFREPVVEKQSLLFGQLAKLTLPEIGGRKLD